MQAHKYILSNFCATFLENKQLFTSKHFYILVTIMDLNPFSRSILPRLRVKMKEPTGKVRVEMNTRSPVPPCPLRQGETTSRTSSPTSSSLWMSECIISHLWVDLLLFSITYLPCSSWPRLRTRRFDPEHLAV